MPSSSSLSSICADLLVVGDHAIAVVVLPALATVLVGEVGPEVHRRRVVPEEERLVGFGLLLHPAESGEVISSSTVSMRFLVSGPVSLIVCLPTLPQRGSVVGSSLSVATQCSTPRGPKLLLERRVLGIVGQFRLFFRVQVIEVAEELVESVHRRQEFIPIAEMVFAELAGGVAERLEQFGDGRVFRLKSERGAGHADFGQAGAERVLAGDEGGASGGAALLAVVVGEGDAFVGDAVDVRRLVAHHAVG